MCAPLLQGCDPGQDIRLFPEERRTGGVLADKRSPTQAPYSSDSIWNTALGQDAILKEVAISPTLAGVRADAVVLLLDLQAPPLSVQHSDAGWTGADRCLAFGPEHFAARSASDFLVASDPLASMPIVALMDDGRTLEQGLPFARCTPNGPATIAFREPAGDLYGAGLIGANGGSGLSALGGVLRLDELLPNSPAPRHALALHLSGQKDLWNASDPSDCFRWPASRGDGSCVDEYGGNEAELRMGSLLALPRGTALALRTLAASKIAWTLENYGAYVVNNAGSQTYAFNVELSANGDFSSQFQAAWGFTFETTDMTSDWGRDLQAIFDALAVVTDNTSATPGGAGNRLQNPLPPLSAE